MARGRRGSHRSDPHPEERASLDAFMSGAREDRAGGVAGRARAAGGVGPLVPSAARSAALGRVGVGAGCAGAARDGRTRPPRAGIAHE
jgi:hypothetical protein